MPKLDRRQFVKTAGAGVAGVSLAGCLGSFTGGGNNEAFKLGLITILDGPFGAVGQSAGNGGRLAAMELTEGDGIAGRDVEISVVGASTADDGVNRARQLVQEENVDVLVGANSSTVELAVQEFAASNELVYMAGGSLSPSPVFWEEGTCERNFFRLEPNLVQKDAAMAKTIAEETEGTRFAGVMPDYTQGHQHWAAITEQLAERKPEIEIVNETYPDFGAGDYQNEIQETLDAEPDIVFTSMWAGDIITFIKQAKQFDFFEEVPHFVSGSGSSIDVMTALGDELPEMIGSDYWDPFYPDSEANFEFVKAYSDNFDAGTTVDKEGSKWDGLTVPNHSTTEPVYSGIKALQLAAEEGGGTTFDDLVAGLEGLTYPSPKGERTIRASDHENIPSIELTGLIGEVDYWQFPGYTEMFTQPGDAITGEPTITCN